MHPDAWPCRRDRISQGLEHADRQHERRFAHGFAAKHVVFAVGFIPEIDVEMRGNVAGGGNFVGAGGVGGQHAALVPHQLLGGQPTHALHKTAFNLADVDGGVDGPANILKDVHPKHAGLTRQRVNRHFGTSRAIGKVVKRPPG